MYIEVSVEGQLPKFFSFEKDTMVVGSSKTCDIVIAEVGISRKHLIIIKENDNYYAIDQGSTNGSYMDDQRLEPEKKTQLTTFFPVRLAETVLLSLKEERDATNTSIHVPTNEQTRSFESTKVIKFKEEPKKLVTESLVQKKKKLVEDKKTKVAPKKKKETSFFSYLLVVMILGGSIYYQFFLNQDSFIDNKPPVKVIGRVIPPPSTLTQGPASSAPAKEAGISESSLVPKESLRTLLSDIKCVIDTEKHLCDVIQGARGNLWGAVQVGSSVNVLVDGAPYIAEAKTYLSPNEMGNNAAIRTVAIFLFIQKAIPAGFNTYLYKDRKLTFALFSKETGRDDVFVAFATNPENLLELKQKLLPNLLKNVKAQGVQILNFINGYVKSY